MIRALPIVVAAGVMTILQGCGGAAKSDVKGKVILAKDGGDVKIVMGSVTFICKDNVAISGPIHKDGTYSVSGVPLGNARILVTSLNPAILPKQDRGKDGKDRGKVTDPRKNPAEPDPNWHAIHKAYSEAEKTPLLYNVVAGENVFDIKLVEEPKK